MLPFQPSLALPALLSSALLAPVPDDVTVAYAPDAGSSLKRSWTFESTLETTASTIQFMENEDEIGVGATTTTTRKVEVTDKLDKAVDGRPNRLVRTIAGATSERDVSGVESGGEGGRQIHVEDRGEVPSELDGLEVVFTWNADDERYDAAWGEDSEGEAEWLEGLREDMDLRAVLPDGPVAEGARWTVPNGVLDDLLDPGGELHVQPTVSRDMPQGGVAIIMPDLAGHGDWGKLEGETTARFAGVREAEGRRLAVIELEFELVGDVDIAERLREQSALEGMDQTYDVATLARTIEGQAVILWDLAAGHAASAQLDADVNSELEVEWQIDAGGMEIGIALLRADEGSIAVSYSIE